jgi:hypothetical protein
VDRDRLIQRVHVVGFQELTAEVAEIAFARTRRREHVTFDRLVIDPVSNRALAAVVLEETNELQPAR